MSPERGCVGIVQVGHRLAELVGQALANIESCPLGMHKVCRTSGTELAGGTGRAGSVEANGYEIRKQNASLVGGDLEAVGDLLEADIWSLLGEGGMLAQALDEKLLLLIDNV